MAETVEKVLYDFLQLDECDRNWVLKQIATREDGNPVDMYVAAAAVFSPEQFDEARERLKLRGYVPLANA
ncbi:MAG: hypothetical protein ABFD46_12040 [Armatimonadota bacterium]